MEGRGRGEGGGREGGREGMIEMGEGSGLMSRGGELARETSTSMRGGEQVKRRVNMKVDALPLGHGLPMHVPQTPPGWRHEVETIDTRGTARGEPPPVLDQKQCITALELHSTHHFTAVHRLIKGEQTHKQ